MNRNTKRLLAVGVSAMALNAVPAFAATSTNAGLNQMADITLSDVLEIGGLAQEYGVHDIENGGNPAVAVANVNSTAEGWFVQIGDGGLADDLLIQNSGTAYIDANAWAKSGSGYAEASASFTGEIFQWADAKNAEADLTNSGNLNVSAYALAQGASADADAHANNLPLVNQWVFASGTSATTTGIALADITNTGNLHIGVVATATAIASPGESVSSSSYNANASASLGTAINQLVMSNEKASAMITNDGGLLSIDVAAGAYNHYTGTASANADISFAGIAQSVFGDTALALVDNQAGTVEVSVAAHANALSSDAQAHAHMYNGIAQAAFGSAATASVVNADAMNIVVAADANAAFNNFSATSNEATATADANMDRGIAQFVVGDLSGKASVDNTGSLAIGVDAKADGNSDANATAAITDAGITQVDKCEQIRNGHRFGCQSRHCCRPFDLGTCRGERL